MKNFSLVNQYTKLHQDLKEAQRKRAQAQSTEKPSTLKKSKPPQYYLTSKEDFEQQKRGLLTAIREAIVSDTVINKPALIAKYVTDMGANDEVCAVVPAINKLTPEALEFLCIFPSGIKFEASCKMKQMLFLARLTLLDHVSKVLPETNQEIFRQSINSFVDAGCLPTIAYKPFNDAVAQAPKELLEEFIKLLPTHPEIIQDTKYSFITGLDAAASVFMNTVNQQFRMVYNTYKANLSLLRTTLELVDSTTYIKATSVLRAKIHALILPNLVVFSDVHYFLHLVRAFHYGSSPTDPYPMPLFTAEEYKQIMGYLSEIVDLLTIMCYINVKLNVNINFLQGLPITRSINKKPAQFFNQAISKNTYSILLNYLSAVNQCLTNTFTAEYVKLSYSVL